MLHPTRQREGFAGRTSPGAAFAAAGTLVLHGLRSSAVAVVWESVGYAVVVDVRASFPHSIFVFSFLEFSCVFRKREKRGGTDLRRTWADHVCLTKSSEFFRSAVSKDHQRLLV